MRFTSLFKGVSEKSLRPEKKVGLRMHAKWGSHKDEATIVVLSFDRPLHALRGDFWLFTNGNSIYNEDLTDFGSVICESLFDQPSLGVEKCHVAPYQLTVFYSPAVVPADLARAVIAVAEAMVGEDEKIAYADNMPAG